MNCVCGVWVIVLLCVRIEGRDKGELLTVVEKV